MELEQFKSEYGFKFTTSQKGRKLIATTEAFRKSDNQRMGGITSVFDVYDIGDELQDSQTSGHAFEWDWEKLMEETKRVHLDHFAKLIPIEDFCPRNRDVDIESLYI